MLKETGRHGFEFPPRGARAKAAGRGKPPKVKDEPKLDTTPRKVVRARKKGGRRSVRAQRERECDPAHEARAPRGEGERVAESAPPH